MPKVIFEISENEEVEIDALEGLSILEIAHQNNIDLEGACEGSLACATCHVIVDKKYYDMLDVNYLTVVTLLNYLMIVTLLNYLMMMMMMI